MIFMSWNVCGLNCPAKQTAIIDVVRTNRVEVLSLQETKIETWSAGIAADIDAAM